MNFNEKKIIFVFSIFAIIFNRPSFSISAVTYLFSGGRFGDNLIAYTHAKWISYKYGIPLLYKPFPYSDQLQLGVIEEKYEDSKQKKFKKLYHLNNSNINIDKNANYLYIVPYFSESDFEGNNPDFPVLFAVDWNDKIFVQELRRCIKPRFNLRLPSIPEGVISVAVHMRKGTGCDSPTLQLDIPHKSCPDSYYIEQLIKLATLFEKKKLFVYIFTDHDKPLELVQLLKKQVNKQNIIYATRTNDNWHNKNVVDDFFGLTNFDCLLRSDSNFSLMAAKLKEYMIQISPKHYVRYGNKVIVDQVKWESNI